MIMRKKKEFSVSNCNVEMMICWKNWEFDYLTVTAQPKCSVWW